MEFWDIYDINKRPTGRTMKTKTTGVLKGRRIPSHRTWSSGKTRWYVFSFTQNV